MKKDYYEILGLPKDASPQQVKKAYRSLALRNHPARVRLEKKKEGDEKFMEISEGYAVLSAPRKRQLFDQLGLSGIDQRYTTEDIFRGADFSSIFGEGGLGDIFGQFFGDSIFGDVFGGAGAGSRRGRARRGRDIQYEVNISLEEAFAGVRKNIKVPREEICTHCNGSGAKPGTQPKTCPTCGGQGQVFMTSGFFRMAQACGACRGQGKIIEAVCPQCQGRTVVRTTRNIEVNIPAGVDNDSRLRVRGEGEVGSAGAGDLYLYIAVSPHSKFERDGRDIYCQLPVSFVTAALGGEESVATLNGQVMMKVPAGTQSGKMFRLKGKGMPDLHGGAPGDQFVKVMIHVPTRLTAEQRRLLEEYARVSGQDVLKGNDSFKEKIKSVFK
jgi:molecular chaperone DnaJ